MSWNDLSMAERAKYIQLGVSNGITNLSHIKDTYNSYAEGGIKSTIINKMLDYTIGDLPISTVRRRLYDKILPVGYYDAYSRFKEAVHNETPDITDFDNPVSRNRDDIWAEYLQIPRSERHYITTYGNVANVVDSNYTPTKKTQDVSYKALDNQTIGRHTTSKGDIYYIKGSKAQRLVEDAFGKGYNYENTDGTNSNIDDRSKSSEKVLKIGENKISGVLNDYFANHTIGRGLDPKEGEYISYYDLWDLSPEGKHGKDQSNGIGKPVEFYDRIYLDDYYEIPKEERNPYTNALYGGYLPELTVHSNKKSYGGKVHKYDGTSEPTQKLLTTGNEWADLGASFIPFVGSAMDVEEAIREPTFGNIAVATLSVGADFLGGSLIKGALKAAKRGAKALDTISDAEKATRRYERALHNVTVNPTKGNSKTVRRTFQEMQNANKARKAAAPLVRRRGVRRVPTERYVIPSDNTRIINPLTIYGTDAIINTIQQFNK